MKKRRVILCILVLAFVFVSNAKSEPWLGNLTPVVDVDIVNGVVQVEVDGIIDTNNYPIKADGTISIDIASLGEGAHILRFRACNPYVATAGSALECAKVWSIPFDLTKPVTPLTLTNPILKESP